MIKILIPILFMALHSIAEECATPLPLDGQPVVELMNYKCFNDEMTKEEISLKLATVKSTKKFCKKCQNPFQELSAKSEDSIKQKRQAYSEAIFNELNKELSFITIDLMKARSSFNLPIDPKEAEKSCQLTSVKTPSCLTSRDKNSDLQHFNQLIKKSQNAIATELANMLSPNPGSGESLLKRTSKNQCPIMESHVLYAQMRYEESLLTKDIIDDLGMLTFQTDKTIDQEIETISKSRQTKTKNFLGVMRSLLTHPVIKAMISEPSELKRFMVSIPKNASNNQIIEMLYESGPAKQFSKSISNRCASAIKQTSELVEKIYCSSEIPFVADTAKSMSLINKKNFGDLTDAEAEKSVQFFCAEINNLPKEKEIASFSDVFKINQHNDSSLVSLPIDNFKTDAFARAIGHDAHAICEASKNPKKCSQDEEARECQMLKFNELLQTNKNHQLLANSSNNNINDILKSMIGSGLPQNEMGVDSYAVDLLRKEGILPGSERREPLQSRDVVSFHKDSSHGQVSKTIKSSSSQMAHEKTHQNINPSYELPSKPYNQSNDPNNEKTNQQSPKIAQGFSSLNDEEQKKILNYLKNKQDRKIASPTGMGQNQKIINEFKPSEEALTSPTETITHVEQVAPKVTPDISPKMSPKGMGQFAKSNQKSISESFNKALQDANLNRSPASLNQSAEPSLSLSKNHAGLNEIDINVSEEEFNKVALFKEKLKELLTTHSEELIKLKEGDKLLISINNHEIILTYDLQTKSYEAKSNDKSLPSDYLNTITHYFNVTLKEGPGKREALLKAFKVSQNHNLPNLGKSKEQSK